MSLVNQDSAFGFRAIGKAGQNNDNQGLSEYNIAASSDAIYQNDPVQFLTTLPIANIGLNTNTVYTAGSVSNFNSDVELSSSGVTSATAQFRILGVSKDILNKSLANATTYAANVNVVGIINEHFLKQSTGI